tara:strand:+ start:591 stop:1118 length:528 start_codon:yes stop_codon:yes gene_type:complete
MIVAFIGPDMTGKSNIASALSKDIGAPVFKNTGEWKTELGSEDYFVNLLRFGGPFLMDFMKQTKPNVILDRFYPCELVYSRAFNRQTDLKAIAWMDNEFSKIHGKFIICLKRNYEGLVDDVYPDQLPTEKLIELNDFYKDFYSTTKCESLILYTDDMDIDRQVADIKQFLFSEEM